jgi:carbonic anhydrase
MQNLLAGYRRFRQQAWQERRRLFGTLAEHGQSPRAMVIACADSRVDPAMIFDAAPGEIFTVHNIAAPARTRAAPETAQNICEFETIKLSLENLRGFPWIAAAERAGSLRLHGASFDIRSGVLSLLDERGQFQPVSP